MVFAKRLRDGVRRGEITCSVRIWTRHHVKVGNRYRMEEGELADDLWMSTCYGRPSVTIHFTWKPDWPAVRRLLPMVEKELSPFQPRPHWGTLFTVARYPSTGTARVRRPSSASLVIRAIRPRLAVRAHYRTFVQPVSPRSPQPASGGSDHGRPWFPR